MVKRILAEAGQGALTEGVTEGAQQTLAEATTSLAADKPFFTEETAKNVALNFVGGVLGGGVLGGVQGAAIGDQPKPSGEADVEPGSGGFRSLPEAGQRANTPTAPEAVASTVMSASGVDDAIAAAESIAAAPVAARQVASQEASPDWQAIFDDEKGDQQIGWHNRLSGSIRSLEEGVPSAPAHDTLYIESDQALSGANVPQGTLEVTTPPPSEIPANPAVSSEIRQDLADFPAVVPPAGPDQGVDPNRVIADAAATRPQSEPAPAMPPAQSVEAVPPASDVHQRTPVDIAVAAPITFQTAKGSTYVVHDDGTTTRDKAARTDPGHEGQSGPQPRSQATFYVTPAQADALSLIQTTGAAPMALKPMREGQWGITYMSGKDTGKVERRTVITPAAQPAVGLLPVEVFNKGRTVHFGNEITAVGTPPAASGAGVNLNTAAAAAPVAPTTMPLQSDYNPVVAPSGKLRGAARRLSEDDVASFLAARGGIRNDESHDLIKGRGLQQMVPGRGPLIRNSGLSIDGAGEVLHEAGFFGPPESTPRPTENEVLQLLEQTGRGTDGKARKVFRAEQAAQIAEQRAGDLAEEQNAAARAEIQTLGTQYGEALTEAEIDQILANMGARDLDAEDALVEHLERKAIQEENADYESATAAPAASEPVPGGEGASDRAAGESGERPAPVAGNESAAEEAREPAAPDSEEARPLAAERGADGLDQTIIPGAEPSARQMAKSREDAGRGKVRAAAPQKDAGGMFAPKLEETKDIFSQPEKAAPAPVEPRDPKTITLVEYDAAAKRFRAGEMTAAEAMQNFEDLAASGVSIKTELRAYPKDHLAKMDPRNRNESKIRLAESIYSSMLNSFNAKGAYTWSPFAAGGADSGPTNGIRKAMAGQTDQDIKNYAEERKKRIADRQQTYTDPQTLTQFRDFISVRGASALTSEQKARYDALVADETKGKSEREKAQSQTVKKVDLGDVQTEIVETKHTQKGHELFVVKLSERVERDTYDRLVKAARSLGGNYSSYARDGAIPGFQFRTRDAAEKFVAVKDGDVSKADLTAAREVEVRDNAVERLRAMAAKMTEQADESLNADRKVNTARRANQAAGAEAQAATNKALATTMSNLADAIEGGDVRYLDAIRTRADVETLTTLVNRARHEWARAEQKRDSSLRYEKLQETPITPEMIDKAEYPYPYAHVDNALEMARIVENKPGFKRMAVALRKEAENAGRRNEWLVRGNSLANQEMLKVIAQEVAKTKLSAAYTAESVLETFKNYDRAQRMGLTNPPTMRAALREFLQYRGAAAKADPVKVAERALIGTKIPGYFPTPPRVVDQMLEAADIRDGMFVLEPSAGKGNILDRLQGAAKNLNVSAIEQQSSLRNILEMKGANIVGRDFLEYDGKHDRIVMNPPFEDRQDVAHVMHAYDLLNPGGRVVAIMSEGPFFGTDKRAEDFREWLDSVNGFSQQLPQGSFIDSERSTGVATRMVVIDKGNGDAARFSRRDDALGPVEAVSRFRDLQPFAARKAAERYALDNLRGTYVNADTDWDIVLSRAGIKKTLEGDGSMVRAEIAANLPALLKSATLADTHADVDARPDVAAVHRFRTQFVLDGRVNDVLLTVKQDTAGTNRHYAVEHVEVEPAGKRLPAGNTYEHTPAPGENIRPDGEGFNKPEIPRVTGVFSSEFDAQREAVGAELRKRLDDLGLKHIALKLPDAIRVEQGGTVTNEDGAYAAKIIAVALDAKDAAGTLDHEAVHAFKALGLFNKSEWSMLANRAAREWRAKFKIDSRYSDLSEEKQNEEAVAEAFREWAKDARAQKGTFARIFDKVRNALSAIGSVLRGRGFQTAESIFGRIERGEVGARERGIERGNDPRIAFSRRQQPQAGIFDRMAVDPDRSVVEHLTDTSRSIVDRLRTGLSRDAITESVDRLRTAFQDRYLPMLRVQNAVERQIGSPLAEDQNPYLKEELSTGRKGAKLEALAEGMVHPLFLDMQEKGVSVAELESYLYARHAPERNARIDKINPAFRGDMLDYAKAGSGMSNDEAAGIMAAAERAGKIPALEALAKRVDGILSYGVEQRVEAGLLSQAEAEAWKQAYKHYVPLRGHAELDPQGDATFPRVGRPLSVKGRESQRAFGRESKASDILAYSIMLAEEAVVRGENNRIAQAFHALAKAAPNPDFWTLDKVENRPVWNKAAQTVEYWPVDRISAEDAAYTISLKIDGVEHRVTLNRNNPAAVRLAEGMKSLGSDQAGLLIHTFGAINRFLSHVNTTLNPEFVITNAFRDVQEASINLNQFQIEGIVKNTLRDYPKALKGSLQGAFKKGDGEWRKTYDEFRAAGGRVYFNAVEDIPALRTRIEREVQDAKPGLTAFKAVKSIFNFIESTNLGVENAVRLSAFKNAREAGMSPSQAASLAKNLTINFNRRGTYGPLMNSLYLFYNASVQGTAVMLTAMKSSKVRKIAFGIVATGAMLEIMNAMMSGTDDDGELFYDKVDDYTKSHNLVIMDPTSDTGRFFKIPLPYGYGSFFAMGRAGAELQRGKDFATAVSNLGTTIMDSFNPVGGAGTLINLIAPTAIDPLVDLFATNRDYAGKPIMPDQPQYGPPIPDNQRYWGSVSPNFKVITDTLNKLTGGDDVVPGTIDVSPETLQYLFGVVTGAAGSFYERNADLVAKVLDPTEDVTFNDIPLARKVVGSKPSWVDKQAMYQRTEEIEQVRAQVKDYRKTGRPAEATALLEKNRDLLSMAGQANAARDQLGNLRHQLAAAQRDMENGKIGKGDFQARKKAIQDREQAIITRFNGAFNARTAEPVN